MADALTQLGCLRGVAKAEAKPKKEVGAADSDANPLPSFILTALVAFVLQGLGSNCASQQGLAAFTEATSSNERFAPTRVMSTVRWFHGTAPTTSSCARLAAFFAFCPFQQLARFRTQGGRLFGAKCPRRFQSGLPISFWNHLAHYRHTSLRSSLLCAGGLAELFAHQFRDSFAASMKNRTTKCTVRT